MEPSPPYAPTVAVLLWRRRGVLMNPLAGTVLLGMFGRQLWRHHAPGGQPPLGERRVWSSPSWARCRPERGWHRV